MSSSLLEDNFGFGPRQRPQTQNVVATVNLGTRLDLKEIVTRSRNAEYNPKKFSAVVMRIRDPKSTALIFETGKVVITGAQSEENARIAARKYARIIQKLSFPCQFIDFKIQNIVGSCDIGFPLRLEGLAFEYPEKSSYEPELFPGLIFRMTNPKVVILIFVSGKIVLTGARTRGDINSAFDYIYPILQTYKKDITDLEFDEDDMENDFDLQDELSIENEYDNDNQNTNRYNNRNNNNNRNNFDNLMSDNEDQDDDLDITSNNNNNNNNNNSSNSNNNNNNSVNDDTSFVAAPQMAIMTENNGNDSLDNTKNKDENNGTVAVSNFDPFAGDDDDDEIDL